jgi:hypothetical protein
MNLVRTGSLLAARRRDSRATLSGTPSSSKRMFPGRTTATQYSDPEFAFALHVAREGDAGRFDLHVGDPRAVERLQSEFAEIDVGVARSGSLAASPLGLPELHAFGHQGHGRISLKNHSATAVAATSGDGVTSAAGLSSRTETFGSASSPLQIQHLMPILPAVVSASAKP